MKNNIRIDSTYVHYKERFDKLDRTENYMEELAGQFLELCEFKKESFKDDITNAVYEISKTNVGLELLYILVDKIVSTDKKVVFMKGGNMLGFSDGMSRIFKNQLIILLNEDVPSNIFSNIYDRNAVVTRRANFTEVLFHELCHVMHYIIHGYGAYKTRHGSSVCVEKIFNFKNLTAWLNDEELYTVTGLSLCYSTKKLSYNPINENTYANELNLSIREVYDAPKSPFALDTLYEIYNKIGFYSQVTAD